MEYIKSGKVIPINNCSTCGKPLKMEWRYCPYCKNETKSEKSNCLNCGQELRTNWNYCPNCKIEVKTELKNRHRADSCNQWLRDILKSD